MVEVYGLLKVESLSFCDDHDIEYNVSSNLATLTLWKAYLKIPLMWLIGFLTPRKLKLKPTNFKIH